MMADPASESENRQQGSRGRGSMSDVIDDFERCYRFMQSRDPRYDGFFFVAVRSTGIYCRPSCPARTPMRSNVRLLSSVAAAQAAGFRACKRCDPDAAPGSPAWNRRSDAAGRAFRLIADGVVDRDGVGGLAARVGYSERHLHRILVSEIGAGPVALARAHRAQAARSLVESTDLRFAEIALGAGFGSVRQFNDTIREIYSRTPTELRRRARSRTAASPAGAIELRLGFREPLDGAGLIRFLGARAVKGVEEVEGMTYRRVLALDRGPAIVELTPEAGSVRCVLRLGDLRDLTAAVARCRGLLDLDADPAAIAGHLSDDAVLGDLVRSRPGLRVPRCVDGFEIAVRAVVGQQVSVTAARTVLGRLVASYGEPLAEAATSLTHSFPAPAAIAQAHSLPMPRARAAALVSLAAAVAEGRIELGPGADPESVVPALLELPGIGPWTAGYIAMRALADPDVFLPSDVGVRNALARHGLASDPVAAARLAERWRPWRSYAMLHLWASLADDDALRSGRSPDAIAAAA